MARNLLRGEYSTLPSRRLPIVISLMRSFTIRQPWNGQRLVKCISRVTATQRHCSPMARSSSKGVLAPMGSDFLRESPARSFTIQQRENGLSFQSRKRTYEYSFQIWFKDCGTAYRVCHHASRVQLL